MELTPEEWNKVKKLFELALQLEPSARSSFLAQNCHEDEVLRSFVEKLVACHEQAGSFLVNPTIASQGSPFSDKCGATFNSGDVLASRFTIIRLIAKGGMGEVYEAEDLELREQVAIKTVRLDVLQQPRALERFKREVHLAKQVTHPNVCRIFDLVRHRPPGAMSESDDVYFVTMELLDGETLSDRLQRTGRMPTEEALPLVIQMATALAAAHDAGILHRDFKPGNVILVPSQGAEQVRAVVTDFGLASRPSNDSSVSLTPTATNDACGTPAYMSPEQIEGREITLASDIYALGLVMYEMVTGARPFEGDTPITIALRRLTETPPSPRTLVPDLDDAWQTVILKCLARDPGSRFGTAEGVAKALSGEQVVSQLPFRGARFGVFLVFATAIVTAATLYGLRLWNNLHENATAHHTVPIKARRSVAVLGFKNLSERPDKAWLSTALSEMLTTELAAGDKLRAIPGEDIAHTRIDLSLPNVDSLGKDTLVRLRSNLGSDVVVLGSYLEMGTETAGRLRLDVRLQDAIAGETIAHLSETGTESGLLDLVSRTGAELRERLGVSSVSEIDAARIRASTSTNPEAIRLYAEGLSELRLFDALTARDLLQQAVTVDPKYALAHSALSAAWRELGYDGQAKEESKIAFELSGSLSTEERLGVEGQFRSASNEWDKAVDVYKRLFVAFPDNVEYGLRLAAAQRSAGDAESALATLNVLRALPPPLSADPRIDLEEARTDESLSDYDKAHSAAARAAEKSEAFGARLLLAASRELEGNAVDSLGQHEEAIAAYERAKQLYAEAGDRGGSAAVLKDIGATLYEQGNLAAAERMFEQALASSGRIGDKEEAAMILLDLSNVAADRGDLDRAKMELEAALGSFRETGDKARVGHALTNLAFIFYELGEYTRAKAQSDQSLAIAREVGDKYGQEACLCGLGDILIRMGDIGESKNRYQECLAMAQEIGDKKASILGLQGLGDLLLTEGDVAAARQKQEQALKIGREIDEKGSAAQVRLSLARVALAEDRPAEAEDNARKAAEEFHNEKSVEFETWANAILAQAFVADGKVGEAQQTITNARKTSRKSQDRALRIYFAIADGQVTAAAGTVAEAEKILNVAIAGASKLGCIPSEYEARLALGEIEMKSGRFGAGREQLRQLEKDARAKGFRLLAKKAAVAQGS